VTDREAIPSRRRGPASPVTSMPDILARRLAAALLAAALALPGLAAEPSASARPLTLDDALALAARQSRDLALARADTGLADADALSAFSGVLPRLDLTGSGGRQFLGPTTVTAAFPVIDFAAQTVNFVQQAVPVPSTASGSSSPCWPPPPGARSARPAPPRAPPPGPTTRPASPWPST